jgi:peptidyl-prolyl cis-trans isomerase SurA
MRLPLVFSVFSLGCPLVLAAAALAQDARLPPAPPPRPVPPPRVLGQGERLPPVGAQKRPEVGTTDDPSAALVIDGVKIDRATYGDALIDEYGSAFLEPFVGNWLIARRASELKVQVTDAEVDAEVEKHAKDLLEKRYRGNEQALRAGLEQAGLTMEAWKEGLRKRVRRDLLATAVVRADRDVSEAALRKEFETRYGPTGERRKGCMVLFSTVVWTSNLYTQEQYQQEKPALEAEARARAEKALAQLRAGADFAAIAREQSDDPMAERGGDYGRYWRNRFGPEADKALESLPVGGLSEVIQTPHGFIVAKATGTQEGWEFHARHILFSTRLEGQPDAALRARKLAEAKAAAEKVLARLRSGEDFAKLAREVSDDPGSKANGGDLGTFASGRMVAPFEQALLALKPGETSGPVESPFGVHVIELISKERKPADDQKLMSVMLFSTDFLKVKERKLKGTLEETAKKRADEVAARLKAGEDAAEIARQLSDDPATKERGGAIEDPGEPRVAPDVLAALRGLAAPGDVTVAKTERGYVVVKLEKIERHKFEDEKAALAKEVASHDPTPAEIRAYREKLRAAAKVLKGKM